MIRKAVVSLVFVLSFRANAQTATGRIVGTVTDPSEAVVSHAKVVVTNTATNGRWETVAGTDGAYQVLDLPIGTYTVSVEKEGFGTSLTKPAELQINQTLRVDVRLVVGAVSQTFAVEAQAAQVETEVPTIGGTVTGATVQHLPLNGRNTLDLALTQPGVVPAATTNFGQGLASNPYMAGSFSIAGGRANSINFLLDGGSNTSVVTNAVVLNPNPDMIAEFRILSNNYTAEYGRNGGGVVSVVTKSGTNHVHGSLYDYLRNEDLNASDYFSNAAGLPRPILKRNQFGGTFGGPIVIPKIVNGKDRLFFFFGYQGQRQVQTLVNPAVPVFTPAETAGDFSRAAPGGRPDPNVAAFLLANPYFQPNPQLASQAIIAPSRINPVSQNIINANMIPTSPNGLQVPQGPSTDNRDEYTGKIDFYATQNDRISATFGYANRNFVSAFGGLEGDTVAGYPSLGARDQRVINIDYTKTFSPKLINELRASADRYLQSDGVPTRQLPPPSALGIQIFPEPEIKGGTILSFDSGMLLGNNGFPTQLFDTTYSVSDTVTWIRGRHTLKAGFSFNLLQNNGHMGNANDGVFGFQGPGGIGSGNSFADFLLGIPLYFQQGETGLEYPRSKGYWSFFQDEWKVTPRLLLTLGVRYEYNTPMTDKRGLTMALIPGLKSQKFTYAPPGLLVPGDPGAPSGDYFPYHAQITPRFGFAWDPTGKGRTSLRGGFGMFDDNLSAISVFWPASGAPWFAYPLVPLPTPTTPITGQLAYMSNPYASGGVPNTFPYPSPNPPGNLNWGAAGLLPVNYGYISPFLKPGYIYGWSLSLQQQLGRTLVAELTYVGNSAHRMPDLFDPNPIILGTNLRLLNVETAGACAPYDCYQKTSAFENDLGHSNYNGMLASLNKRLGNWHSLGETFYTVSYTWSHMLDNADGYIGNGTRRVPYYNHDQFYGNATDDVRQRLVISGEWEIPFAHLWSSGPRRLTSGWRLFPIFAKQSGSPLDVLAQVANPGYSKPGPSGAGDGDLVRANLAGRSVQTFNPAHVQTINGITGNFFFNPNSFAPNPASWSCQTCIPAPNQRTYGTYGRNSVFGPGFSNLDLSLEKRTPFFGEKVESAFRVEAFNVINHPEFWLPNTDTTSSTFGLITSVNPNSPSRILQLALKLTF